MPSIPQPQESTLSTPASSHHHTTTPITTTRTPSAFQPQVGAFSSPPSPTAPTTKKSNPHNQISNPWTYLIHSLQTHTQTSLGIKSLKEGRQRNQHRLHPLASRVLALRSKGASMVWCGSATNHPFSVRPHYDPAPRPTLPRVGPMHAG